MTLRKAFHRGAACFLSALTVGPYAVSVDSTQTRPHELTVGFFGGSGRYADVNRGCEGNVISKRPVQYTEASASADYFARPWHFGFRGHYFLVESKEGLPRRHEGFVYNPYVMIEGDYGAFGLGYASTPSGLPESQDTNAVPSIYARLGHPDRLYFDGAVFHGSPMMTGQLGKFGVGSAALDGVDWWLGTGGGPFDEPGLLLRTDIRILPRTWVRLMGRYGSSQGINESGFAGGVTHRFTVGGSAR